MVRTRATKRRVRRGSHLWQAQLGLFFILLIVLIVSSILVRIVGLAKASLFDGYHRFTVVVDGGESISAVTLEPKTKRASLVSLPRNVLAKAPVGEGEYKLGIVFQLGQLEGSGGQLLQKTTQLLFGAPVDGWMVSKIQNSDQLFSLQSLPLVLINVQNGSIDTNLTPIDIVRITISLHRIGEREKKKVLFLEHVVGTSTEKLPDGTEILRVRESSIDRLSKEHFLDRELLEEKIAVSVVNSTDRVGLGSRVARILTNAGVNVVSVTGTSEKSNPLDRSIIEVQEDKRDSYTLKRIASLFEFDSKTEPLVKEDMRIVLGSDIWK